MTPKTKLLYDGKFIRVVESDSWEFVERKNCRGIVIILALSQDNQLIITEQFRRALNRSVIELPAGLIDDLETTRGESAQDAAARELFEETGYKAQEWIELISGPTNTGLSSDVVTLFRAKDLKKEGSGGGDHTENITVHEVPLRDVPKWLKKQEASGKLVDPKIYAGLYFLSQEKEL